MAVFNFDQMDNYIQTNSDNISFLKLADDKWSAKIRFMYGPGETFQGYSVHKICTDPTKPKFVPCLREAGQPLDVCPLCNSGNPAMAQFYIPVYVISVTKCINGVTQAEEVVNQAMLLQRGKTFAGCLASAVRQSAGTPLVNNVFNIVRNGRAKDTSTTYLLEFVSRDNTSLNDLPERVEALGTYILPNVNYNEMLTMVNTPQTVVPRTIGIPQATVNGQVPPVRPF